MEPGFVSNTDSALFYLDKPAGKDNRFWQVFKMEQYRLSFVNISNLQWYARHEPGSKASFTTGIVSESGTCITQFKNTSNSINTQWTLFEGGTSYEYTNRQVVDLPGNFPLNAIITLTIDGKCAVTKRVGDDLLYLKQKEACSQGAPSASLSSKTVLYPNPGDGVFYGSQNGNRTIAKQITVFNIPGLLAGRFNDTSSFDISRQPAGIYLYQVRINGELFNGKLIKR